MGKLAKSITKVYFDESGFTGNNLLNKEQPFFVYSAVAMDENLASSIIEELRDKYNLKSTELKFKTISKKSNCVEFSLDVLEKIKDNSSVACFDKQFGLCAKFFEYIFEPCLSEINSLFYSAGFHHYITYNLYNEIFQKPNYTALLVDFESVMKIPDKEEQANSFLKTIEEKHLDVKSYKETFKGKVCIFAVKNQRKILEEMDAISGDSPIDKYSLDLTYTALFTLCAEMSSRYSCIEAIYDESKVLDAHREIFNSFVGRRLRFPCLNFLSGKEEHVINLASELSCASSEISNAIQLADLLAGITNYAFKNNEEKIIHSLTENKIIATAVIPQIHKSGIVEVLEKQYQDILDRLVKNSVNNRNLVDDCIKKRLYAISQATKQIESIYF